MVFWIYLVILGEEKSYLHGCIDKEPSSYDQVEDVDRCHYPQRNANLCVL